MKRDNEKIIEVASQGIEHLRDTAIALLQAGADLDLVREVLTATQILQQSIRQLCEPEHLHCQGGGEISSTAELRLPASFSASGPTDAYPPVLLNHRD